MMMAAAACNRMSGPALDDAAPSAQPGTAVTSESFAQARQLRFDAGDALDKHDWKKALDLFDRAQALDPAGEGVPWIRNGRAFARDGLAGVAWSSSMAPNPPNMPKQ